MKKLCSTCDHFPNDGHCVGCHWDDGANGNSKWEMKRDETVIERKVIDEIKADIEAARYGLINDGLDVALRIIDKHVGGNDKPVEESEESEFRKKMRLSRGESCYLDQGITQC